MQSAGGFGTRADCETITIEFTEAGARISALDGELSDEIVLDKAAVEELYKLSEENLPKIMEKVECDEEASAAGWTFDILIGERYGGYCVTSDYFKDVVSKAYDVVGEDNIRAFRSRIDEWYSLNG